VTCRDALIKPKLIELGEQRSDMEEEGGEEETLALMRDEDDEFAFGVRA